MFRRLPGSFSTALADAELALPPEVIAALGEGRRLYAISVDW